MVRLVRRGAARCSGASGLIRGAKLSHCGSPWPHVCSKIRQMQRACVGTYLLHRHEGPVDSHLRLPELLPQNIVRLCLTRNPRSGRGSLGSPAVTNFKQRQTEFMRPLRRQLARLSLDRATSPSLAVVISQEPGVVDRGF